MQEQDSFREDDGRLGKVPWPPKDKKDLGGHDDDSLVNGGSGPVAT